MLLEIMGLIQKGQLWSFPTKMLTVSQILSDLEVHSIKEEEEFTKE
jgi:hypothetical protein